MAKPHEREPPNPPPQTEIYEIVKIWIPTHGGITVYRKPSGDFEVENGCHLGVRKLVNGTELKILSFYGSVITVTRNVDGGYVLDPKDLHYETTHVPVEPNN